MRKALVLVSLLALALPAIGSIATAPAMAGDDNSFKARLSGYQEVATLSTTGRGQFRARLVTLPPVPPALVGAPALQYELQYSGLEGGAVSGAHIHLGAKATNGGIIADLCGGTKPVCPAQTVPPAAPATVTGQIVAADVLGPTVQGIAPGEFAEMISAMRADATYVNVHTATYPGGDIRGQVDD
jgi:hypothetical protein